MLESELKKRGSKKLEDWGWEVIHLIQTNKNGIPDTIILKQGRALFIEWKQKGKHPEPLQVYRHQKLKEQGFTTYVIRDLTELDLFKSVPH